MTLQMAMMQQQQEQNRAILDVMNKIVNKNWFTFWTLVIVNFKD
jgi:hypothetical protein